LRGGDHPGQPVQIDGSVHREQGDGNQRQRHEMRNRKVDVARPDQELERKAKQVPDHGEPSENAGELTLLDGRQGSA
jgi:hypothetical protein